MGWNYYYCSTLPDSFVAFGKKMRMDDGTVDADDMILIKSLKVSTNIVTSSHRQPTHVS